MKITVKFNDESVTSLLKKLTSIDVDVVEVYDEESRRPPYTGIRAREGDVAKDTAAQARGAIQNG